MRWKNMSGCCDKYDRHLSKRNLAITRFIRHDKIIITLAINYWQGVVHILGLKSSIILFAECCRDSQSLATFLAKMF